MKRPSRDLSSWSTDPGKCWPRTAAAIYGHPSAQPVGSRIRPGNSGNIPAQSIQATVDEHTIDTYIGIAEQHLAAGNSIDATMHLLVQNILISPRFIYRQISPAS